MKTASEENYSSWLFQTLKDHKCEEAIRLTVMSQTRLIRAAASKQGFQMDNVALTENSTYSSKPVQLTLTSRLNGEVHREVLIALDKIKFTGLDLKLIDECNSGKYFSHTPFSILGF